MKHRTHSYLSASALLAILVLNLVPQPLRAQGTAFVYQGQLASSAAPVNGTYDFAFTLFTANTGGLGVAGITNSAVAVTNGLFTTTLDFGAGVFNGTPYWLELGVRTNGAGTFTSLSPRQPVSPAPYAMYSANANSAATATSASSVAATNISGTFSLTQLPAALVTNGASGVNLFGTFSGNGGGLTNLPLTSLVTNWQTNYMNFDTVNASNGPLDATAYLSSFGITLTNVNPANSVYIFNDNNYYSGGAVTAPSLHNFLLQNVGGSPNNISYTLLFSTPLQSVTFTRPAVSGSAATPVWSVTAYAGAVSLGSVGVNSLDGDTGQPAHVYTLNGPGITSLTVTASGFNFTALSSVPLDDFYMVQPSPGLNVSGSITAASFSGNGAGLTNISLPALQSGGATNGQILTWNGSAWVAANVTAAPAVWNRTSSLTQVTNFATSNYVGNVAVNPNLNKVYLSAGASGEQPIVIVDGGTFAQSSAGLGMGVDVDLTNNNYWSGGVYTGDITDWNSSNTSLGSVPLSGCPFEISMDAPHRRVWAGAQCSDSIWVVNADTRAIISGPIGPGSVMSSLLVNPTTGRAYFSSGGSKRVNPSTFAVTANSFGTVIGVDPVANRLYAQSSGNTLQIINGAPDPEVVSTNVTLPFAVGGGYIGVNPTLGQAYLANGNSIVTVDGSSGTVMGTVSLDPSLNVGNISVDASRGRVYAVVSGGGSTYLFVFQSTTTLVSPTVMNYLNAYSTSTQGVTTASTFQDIASDVNNQISGWTHAAGTVSFTNNQTALYLVQYSAESATTSSTTTTVTLRAVVNGTEIPDSQSTAVVNTSNQITPISKSFIAAFNAGDVLKFQLAGSSTVNRIVSNSGLGTTRPSFSCTIIPLQ